MKQSTRIVQALEYAGYTRGEPSRRQGGFLLALQPSGAYRVSFYRGGDARADGAWVRQMVAAYAATLERKGFYVRAVPEECALVVRAAVAAQ